jgi:hypothetical protein
VRERPTTNQQNRAHPSKSRAIFTGPRGNRDENPAYLGSDLSGEQLTNLSLDETEASMKDKLGKSSHGLVLQPGQGVPFLIVFRDVPQG